MEFGARYSDVAQFIAHAHGVPEERLTALRGRLQHLQKLRFPDGVNTGRGRPAVYGASQALMIALALEFVALGIAPERAVKVLRDKGKEVAAAAGLVLNEWDKERPEPVFIRLEPAALFDDDPGFGYTTASSLEKFLRQSTHLSGFTRHAIINLTGIIERLVEWAQRNELSSSEEFRRALREWVSHSEEPR